MNSRINMRTITTHRNVGKAALLLFFPAVALLLQSAVTLYLHTVALYIAALVLPMTILPPTALLLYRRYGLPAGVVVKYALVSLVLITLSTLLPLLFSSV